MKSVFHFSLKTVFFRTRSVNANVLSQICVIFSTNFLLSHIFRMSVWIVNALNLQLYLHLNIKSNVILRKTAFNITHLRLSRFLDKINEKRRVKKSIGWNLSLIMFTEMWKTPFYLLSYQYSCLVISLCFFKNWGTKMHWEGLFLSVGIWK